MSTNIMIAENRNTLNKFQPVQLISARKLRTLSLRELAEALGEHGVALSKQAINKYETGASQPPQAVIDALAQALAVPQRYFFQIPAVSLGQIEFRKLDAYAAKERDRVEELVKMELGRYLELEAILNIDAEFKVPFDFKTIETLDDIERFADQLRGNWDLGTAPIANVIETLETHHIKVIQVSSDVELDGFSAKANNKYPVIVLNRSKLDAVQDRKRWTALHELAHLLLVFGDLPHKQVERYCHYFAGAMLFPRDNFFEEIGRQRSKLSLQELAAFKQEYGISMQAIVYRAKELGVISESYYRQFFFLFNQLGYKTKEPVDYIGKKAASRFDQLLFKALTEEVITLEKAAELKGKTVEEFRKEYPFM
jgi:Zn-dependent peptidase ImmA (M78 family)